MLGFMNTCPFIIKMIADDSMETLFYDMQRQLYNEWGDTFECDTDSKFISCHRNYTGFEYHAPMVVDDNHTMGILCLTVLEKCLDAEHEYPRTFWVECMRIFIAREFAFDTDKPNDNLFDSFIGFMLSFNNTYPLTLPSIFHSTQEMHRAIQFFIPRIDGMEAFVLHVMASEILLKYESENPEELHEEEERPEDSRLAHDF